MRLDEYTLETVRGYLLHLHEIRALTIGGDGRDDKPRDAHLREALFCVLWDIERAVRQLPEPLRLAVYWHYECLLTEREAARRLGICQRALHKRILRAEQEIKDSLLRGTHAPDFRALSYIGGQK